MTTYATKVIQDPNLGLFIDKIVEAALDGWAIDQKNPPALYGFYYETILLKDEALDIPTPTRSDILTNARAAKKAKRSEAAQAPQNVEDTPTPSESQENAPSPVSEAPEGIAEEVGP